MLCNTINVIQMNRGSLYRLWSFTTDKSGIKMAEDLFAKIGKDTGFDDGDIEDGLENGYLDSVIGSELYISHSTPID